MIDELIIDISPRGKTQALHMDDFDLGFLGKKKIKRASEIYFNEESQLWDIRLAHRPRPECEAVLGFTSYDIARMFEVAWLQGSRKLFVEPFSPAGVDIAERLREGLIDG